MGFLSSLFGMADKPTTTTQNVVPTTPSQMQPYVDQVLQDSQALYERRLAQGYQPYQGQTIAGFTPEEVASQEGLKGLIGTQAPLQQEALNLARGTDREFTADTAQQYMSPYLRTALDAQKAQAQRQYESVQQPKFEAAAVAAGGMSGLGSRAAVQAAEMDSNQQRMLADIEAAGQQQAYESAAQLFQDQTNRERQAASQISTAAPNIYKANVQDMGLLAQIGEDKRGLAQGVLDEAYSKYIEQQQFPEQQLARYQSSIYGSPLLKQPSYSNTTSKTGGGPSTGKTLLGLGAGIMGFGGSNSLGSSLMKKINPFTGSSGGGIGSTMKAQEYINRNMGGPVMPPVVYRQTGSIDDETKEELGFFGARKKDLDMLRKAPSSPVFRDEQGLPSIGNIPYADKIPKSNDTRSSSIAALKRAAPDSVLSQSRNEAATANAFDPQGAEKARQDFAEFGITDETGNDLIKLENKLLSTAAAAPVSTKDKDKLPSPSEASQITVDAARNAANVGIETALSVRNIDKETSNSIRGELSAFSDKYKKLAANDPYKMAKFWATISANIMKPGNAFANMAQGVSIAINDLDATRKEKDKLLMELEDTMAKSRVKLIESEGKSKIDYTKFTGKQRAEIAKLGKVGLDAFNAQLKVNGDYIAALAAAKKAETAALKEARKDRGGVKSTDVKNFNDVFNNAFKSLKPFFGIGKGKPMDGKQADYKSIVVERAVEIANGDKAYNGKTGVAAANSYIQNQARTYKKK